jgi:hypothetical protein
LIVDTWANYAFTLACRKNAENYYYYLKGKNILLRSLLLTVHSSSRETTSFMPVSL